MNIADELAGSPELHALKYVTGADAVGFLRLREADYHAASFLDERIVEPTSTVQWLPFSAVARAMAAETDLKPLHFIFHSGHVGSTLLSRLIEEAGGVLGLREPLPLRVLAEMHDTPASVARFEVRLETFLRLWRRGFVSTRSVVLKATSSCGRICNPVLKASPDSKAVYLSLKAEPYLATLLAGANAMTDLRGFERERSTRLRLLLGEKPPTPATAGELAAMSWLCESLTRADAAEQLGPRLQLLDFEAMLADMPGTLASVLKHFEIPAPAGFLGAIGNSPVLSRYSKAPKEYAYSPATRAELLAQARSDHGGEIEKGLAYLARLGQREERVRALL